MQSGGKTEYHVGQISGLEKSDTFLDVLACGQIRWLAGAYIARAIQGLSIPLVEVGTVGFAIPVHYRRSTH